MKTPVGWTPEHGRWQSVICPADAHQIHTNALAGEQGTRDAVISKGSGSTKKKCEGGNGGRDEMKGATKMEKVW